MVDIYRGRGYELLALAEMKMKFSGVKYVLSVLKGLDKMLQFFLIMWGTVMCA